MLNAKEYKTMSSISIDRNKFIKLNLYKHLKHHNSMRNDRILIIFATLNFAQFII